jgi:hypothetical protein
LTPTTDRLTCRKRQKREDNAAVAAISGGQLCSRYRRDNSGVLAQQEDAPVTLAVVPSELAERARSAAAA